MPGYDLLVLSDCFSACCLSEENPIRLGRGGWSGFNCTDVVGWGFSDLVYRVCMVRYIVAKDMWLRIVPEFGCSGFIGLYMQLLVLSLDACF